MNGIKIGFAMCGSFCTFSKVIPMIEEFTALGADVTPIMSQNAWSTDTRFGKAADFAEKIENITGKQIIHTISAAEPIGPKKLLDVLVIAPCTGNTLAKLANGITDTSVTLAAKAHLRNERPVVIAPATNDALSAAAKNIGLLMNAKNIFFAPMQQDDFTGKPNSMIAHFSMLPAAVEAALDGRQIQPMFSPEY